MRVAEPACYVSRETFSSLTLQETAEASHPQRRPGRRERVSRSVKGGEIPGPSRGDSREGENKENIAKIGAGPVVRGG